MTASILFRVVVQLSLDTGGGSIYVNLLSGLSSGRLVCDTGVFRPTPQKGIFQRAHDRNSPVRDLGGQGRNDHRYLKLLALTPSADIRESRAETNNFCCEEGTLPIQDDGAPALGVEFPRVIAITFDPPGCRKQDRPINFRGGPLQTYHVLFASPVPPLIIDSRLGRRLFHRVWMQWQSAWPISLTSPGTNLARSAQACLHRRKTCRPC
jgi:hypothetical protein